MTPREKDHPAENTSADNANTSGAQPHHQPDTGDRARTPDAASDVERLLNMIDRPGRIAVGIGDPKTGVFRREVVDTSEAPNLIKELNDGTRNLYLGIGRLDTTLTSSGGSSKDVRAIGSLPIDIDVKPEGVPSWDAARAVVDALSNALQADFAAVINTGHGLQPWPITDPDDDQWINTGTKDPHYLNIQAALRRFQRLVNRFAAIHGGAADNVSDLARVLRAPGTLNVKDPNNPIPVTVERWGTGTPITMQRLLETFDEYDIPELPEDRELIGDIQSAHGDWEWADTTCNYVTAMINGWETDQPNARHPWLVNQATRLAAAHRNGCITQNDHQDAISTLTDTFQRLLTTGQPRTPGRNEVSDAIAWGITRVERKSSEEVAAELGDHTHGDGEALFDLTPQLRWIKQRARERMVSPWALLASLIAIANAGTHPSVVIPPFIGDTGSLNTGVVLIGPSGSGKSAAYAVAENTLTNWITHQNIHNLEPSSGEGIITLFAKTHKDGSTELVRERVVSYFDEIGRLAAQGERSGATFMSNLRTGITGGRLSNHAADPTRQRNLRKGTYRWSVIVGAQPTTAQAFLRPEEIDAGTPQRFLWAPAIDPHATGNAPQAPDNPFTQLHLPVDGNHITYPENVAQHVKEQHLARQRGEKTRIDGHATLTRLKVAAGLAILHGTTTVTQELWDASQHIMDTSDTARTWAMKEHRRNQEAAIKTQGRNNALREEAGIHETAEKAVMILAKKVHRHRDGISRREAKDALGRYKTKGIFDEVVDLAIQRGLIVTQPPEGRRKGLLYCPGPVKP